MARRVSPIDMHPLKGSSDGAEARTFAGSTGPAVNHSVLWRIGMLVGTFVVGMTSGGDHGNSSSYWLSARRACRVALAPAAPAAPSDHVKCTVFSPLPRWWCSAAPTASRRRSGHRANASWRAKSARRATAASMESPSWRNSTMCICSRRIICRCGSFPRAREKRSRRYVKRAQDKALLELQLTCLESAPRSTSKSKACSIVVNIDRCIFLSHCLVRNECVSRGDMRSRRRDRAG